MLKHLPILIMLVGVSGSSLGQVTVERTRRGETETSRRPLSADDNLDLYFAVIEIRGLCKGAGEHPCPHLEHFEGTKRPHLFDREQMASYLIEQWEAGLQEGFFPDYAILEYIANTQSETGLRYLEKILSTESDRQHQEYALRGLIYSKDPRVRGTLLDGLKQDAADPLRQMNARYRIIGIKTNMVANGETEPRFEEALKELERDGYLKRDVARYAYLALDELDHNALLIDRQWRPSQVPERIKDQSREYWAKQEASGE